MSASLVGSEMCIRDRYSTARCAPLQPKGFSPPLQGGLSHLRSRRSRLPCLLYTSDAADDM
eukprot:13205330-Alexandrium_andersonii.AAC.1